MDPFMVPFVLITCFGVIIFSIMIGIFIYIVIKKCNTTYIRAPVITAIPSNASPYPFRPVMPLPVQTSCNSGFTTSPGICQYPPNMRMEPAPPQLGFLSGTSHLSHPPAAAVENPPSYKEATCTAYAQQEAYNPDIRQ